MKIPVVGAKVVASRPAAAETPGTGGLRILVIDDNVDAANSLAGLLRLWGHDVHVAYDGTTALAMHRQLDPQVVLSDIGLPDVSGLELARHFRRDLAHAPPLLVAISGYGRDGDRARSLEAGFDEHMVKPIDTHRLKTLLATPRS